LAPTDARGGALVDMHMKLCDLQFTRQAGAIVFSKRFLPKEIFRPSLRFVPFIHFIRMLE
jgi:hypothetical protein